MDTLDADAGTALQEYFAFLAAVDAGWPRRIAQHIADGSDPAVLQEMRATAMSPALGDDSAKAYDAAKADGHARAMVEAAFRLGAEAAHRASQALDLALALACLWPINGVIYHHRFDSHTGTLNDKGWSEGFLQRHPWLQDRRPPHLLRKLVGSQPLTVDARLVLQALAPEGVTGRHLLAWLLHRPQPQFATWASEVATQSRARFLTSPGLAAVLLAEADMWRAELLAPIADSEDRLNAIDFAIALGVDPALTGEAVSILLRHERKSDRRLGIVGAQLHPGGFALVAAVLAEGSAAARAEAAPVLMALDAAAALPVLQARRAAEKTAKVVQVLDALIAAAAPSAATLDAARIELPPYSAPDRKTQLPGAVAAAWLPVLIDVWHRSGVNRAPTPPTLADAQRLLAFVNGHEVSRERFDGANLPLLPRLAPALMRADVRPAHLIRLHGLRRFERTLGWHDREEEPTDSDLRWNLPPDLWRLARSHDGFDLRTLADLLEENGRPRSEFMQLWLDEGDIPSDYVETAEDLWPYILEQLDILVQAIQENDVSEHRNKPLLAALEILPQLPQRLLPGVVDRAFGDGARHRPDWQAQLKRSPQATELATGQLGAGQADRRGRAAAFLARQGDRKALPALQDALAREKSEAVRGELLAAIHDLGGDISAALSRDTLERKAARTLAKETADTAWISWDRLAPLHWAADGSPVPTALQRAWVLDALAARQATPNGTVRALLALIRPDDARRQALDLVTLWMGDPRAASRGLLALAGPAAGPDLVPLLQPLIAKAKGDKRAEILAAAELLAQIDAPAAMQGLLTVSSRFATGTVRDTVDALIADLADRHGWSRDELADRAVPDLGLDAAGRRELDLAGRTVAVQLTAAMELDLTVDGKRTKTLPAATDGDALEAKKLLTTLKAELKAAMALQPQRLRDAAVAGRRWRGADWQALVQAHPLMGRLAQRLVWMLPDGTSFRPHADGALLDAGDEPVSLPADADVMLAHDTRLDPAAAAAWSASFAAYRIAPLFAQFGRPALPPLPPHAMALEDFRGWCIDSLPLRSAALARSWRRGPVGDGGGFDSYLRRFPALNLEAELQFTGSALPEENCAAALLALRFARGTRPLPLAEVPEAALFEAHADMSEIAASGSGFDPGWADKVAYG